MKWLGKILFPGHGSFQRQKEMRTLAVGIVLAVLVAAIVGVLMFYINHRRVG
jgi:hypothetical protein